MCENYVAFIPSLPKGFSMPPGFALEGVSYPSDTGRMCADYYWVRTRDYRCGDNVKDKRAACRQAWLAAATPQEPPR
jgi:hypothetical protein